MNTYDVGHCFYNQDFGKNGRLTAGNVSVEGRNYYSYRTVFGQWLDLKKKVCLVYIGSTSTSSSKHQLYSGMFPDDVHVFPYDDKYFNSGYGYHGCDLVWVITDDSDFLYKHRVKLLDYFIDVQFNEFKYITTTKNKGAEKVSFQYWGYALELCSLYEDTTIKKWLKIKGRTSNEDRQKKKMVGLLLDGVRDVETITDAMFGDGAYQTYMNYSERFRRQERKKRQMEWLCERLGIESPYEGNSCYNGYNGNKLSAGEIRKLTAKQRNEIHFNSVAYKEWKKNEGARKEKYKRNKRNAYVYIVGYEPVVRSKYSSDYNLLEKVRNRFNGEVYDVRTCLGMPYFFGYENDFKYDAFRKSENPEKWIHDFYDKCKKYDERLAALRILRRINANKKEKKRSWDDDRYINDEFLRQNTSDEEFALCVSYINDVEKHFADEEARERAEAIRRQREEEERQREKELQERLKQEEIDRVFSNGIEGGIEGPRNLWRMHYMSCDEAMRKWRDYGWVGDESEFYEGGNVLMRFNMDRTIVETSKRIRLDIKTCKRMWKIINVWHNDPSKFRKTEINTHYSGTYTIVSYENDILTAGCHKIAYAEMERMYNEIIESEKIA